MPRSMAWPAAESGRSGVSPRRTGADGPAARGRRSPRAWAWNRRPCRGRRSYAARDPDSRRQGASSAGTDRFDRRRPSSSRGGFRGSRSGEPPPRGDGARDRGRELSRGRRTRAEGAAARGASWKRDENVIIHRGAVPVGARPECETACFPASRAFCRWTRMGETPMGNGRGSWDILFCERSHPHRDPAPIGPDGRRGVDEA